MTAAGGDGAPAVRVEGVVKRFGPVLALDGVALRVRRGEVYGLLGPNGSGKTTLIRCLVGLVRPDAGAVRVLGRTMPDVDVLARVGYMTQAAALYPDLSVQENVRFFATIAGGEGGIDDALRLVDLEDRRHSVVATLSGGMRTAPPSPARWCTGPRCSCWTSPRSASTRCSARSSGSGSGPWRAPARRSSSPAT